jgi:O-acetyl-ADP-ribose deacetylase
VIRVLSPDRLAGSGAEALILSMGSDLEPLTAMERDLGRAAGPGILDRMRSLGELSVGGAVVTPAGDLPVEFLIHVVLRAAEEPVSEAGLRRALLNGLRQAAEWGIQTLALPPLGTGAGNLDAEEVSRITLEVIRLHRMESLLPAEYIVLAGGEYEKQAFRRAAERLKADVRDASDG